MGPCLANEVKTCALPFFFFFNDTAPTEIYTLSLHDALPISYNETVDAWQWTENLTPGNANVFDSDGNTPENGDDGGGHIYNSCDGIMITELMPSPAGPDGKNEWIELYNSNGETSDLDGCVLNDKLKAGSTKKYTFTKGMHIGSGSYLKLGRPKTKITLNNNSDGVTLMDSRGVIVFDTGLYTDAREGLSYAYHEGSWFWTETPTPGGANIITEPPAKEVKSSKKSKKKKNAKKPPKRSEEHTSELQSHSFISYAVFCLKKKKK